MSVSASSAYESQPKSELIATLIEKDHEILKLQNILHKLQKEQFGSKSEKRTVVADNQLPLLPEEVVDAPRVEPQTIEVPAHQRTARTQRDLSGLPHIRIVYEPESKTCPCCGKELSQIGEDVSNELEHQPARLFVNEHVRPRYACGSCKNAIIQAELPSHVKPLERCVAGAGLLSNILVSKYVDHLPLHRQEQMFERKGVSVPRRLLSDWVGGVVEQYLTRLWQALRAEMFEESYLQGDETTLKVQDNETPGTCHTGYLWGAYSPAKQLVLFEYAPSRAGSVAKDVFADFKGVLQTDAYAGYNAVLLPDKVQRIACLAHVRRKFIEVEKTCPKETTTVLTLIAELYRLDNQWRALAPPERKAKRDIQLKPLLFRLEKYLRDLVERTLPKAPLMEAINYTLSQWQEIMRILEDGRFHLDNNAIEREMRPIALGRKNYLFAGSHEGAKRAAIIYSLLGTARQHKVNPYDWLKDVLQRLRAHPVNKVAELLPHNWKKIAT